MKQIELDIERYNQEMSNMRETAKIRAGKSNKSLEAAKLEYVNKCLNQKF